VDLLPIEWIVLSPLAGALAIGIGGRFGAPRSVVHGVGVGSVAFAFVVALQNFIELYARAHPEEGMAAADPAIVSTLWEWFSVHVNGANVPVNVRFVFDHLSGLMSLVVTGIGSLIHLYSVGYMDEEPSYARFFAYLNLFTASMLVLVLGSSLPVMFVGWEGVGLCSYLLIGFWFENPAYAAAGRKAFVANRIGDFGVLIGMFILLQATSSFEFAEINQQAGGLGSEFFLGGNGFTGGMSLGGASVATVACLFLFLGCTGKSAQVPLYVWLPDAMAGPTPVSALIHAATMVTAGVYLCCRLSDVFLMSPTAMAVIAIVGSVTAFLAATIAVVQREMKKILAYSTVSQLGFMFAAVGVGAFAAGFFHVFTHAFFKACLFLGAGSVMHAVHAHGDADIFKLGGLKKHMPITHWTFLFSCLAIAGFPLTSGFFSKDEILLGATTVAFAETDIPQWVGWFVLVTLFLAATMTAFYMFRLYFLTFTGSYRSAESHDHHEEHDDAHGEEHDGHHDHGYAPKPHENGIPMVLPLLVLGVGALVVGFLGLPHHLPFAHTDLSEYHWWGHWLETSVSHLSVAETPGLAVDIAAVAGLLAMGIGIGGAFVAYNGKSEDKVTAAIPKPIHSFLFDKWRVDELYERLILGPIKQLAILAGWIDKTFVDGLLTKATSKSIELGGFLVTRLQVGVVHAYALAVVLGLALMSWWFLYPHPSFETEVAGPRVTMNATAGLGYEYRWDLDGDGNYDAPVQPSVVTLDLVDALRSDTEGKLRGLGIELQRVIGGDWPRDRRALGTMVDGSHQIYEMHPPPERLADLLAHLDGMLEAEDDGHLLDAYEVRATEEAYGTDISAQHTYDRDDYRGALVVFQSAGGTYDLEVGDTPAIVDPALLGPNWQRPLPMPELAEGEEIPETEYADPVPPAFVWEDGKLILRPNGARVFRGEQEVLPPNEDEVTGGPEGDRDDDGVPDADDECETVPEDRDDYRDDDGCPEEGFPVNLNAGVRLANAPVSIVPVVEVTLEVRNAFGNRGRETTRVPLRTETQARAARVEVLR